MFDISNVNIDEITNKIYNHDKMIEFANEFNILAQTVRANDFRKLHDDEQRYIINHVIKRNRQHVVNEIVRLLNITNEFARTKYFNDLAKLVWSYHELELF